MDSVDPFGQALWDYFEGRREGRLTFHNLDAPEYRAELPVSQFFPMARGVSAVERCALESCQGRVFDLGAGGGDHARLLVDDGFEVLAVDRSPTICGVLRRRGLRVVEKDLFRLDAAVEGLADTLLMLGNGSGLVGTLHGLARFFHHARTVLGPGGQVLMDSIDLTRVDPGYVHRVKAQVAPRFYGETPVRIGYAGQVGEPFPWLTIDPTTLAREGRGAGWQMEVLVRQDDGSYLARLRPDDHACRED